MLLPLLSLGLHDILEVHDAEQEFLEGMTLILKLIETVEPLLIRLRILDKLIIWDFFALFLALDLFFLFLFLFFGELWALNDVLGILSPLSRGDG